MLKLYHNMLIRQCDIAELHIHRFDHHARLHPIAFSIFVPDVGFDIDFFFIAVKRFYQFFITLDNKFTPYLSGARQLFIIGIELFVQQDKSSHLGHLRQGVIGLGHLFGN